MKKLLFVLFAAALPSFGALNLMTWDGSKNSDFNDTANWTGTVASGSTLGTGDSCLMNSGSVAATASGNISIGAIRTVNGGYSGNLSFSGYTLTVANGANFDGSGTLNLGNGVTMNGASSTLHIGSTVGTVTGTSCTITFNGTTGCTLDIDKAMTLLKLSIAANAIVTATNNGELTCNSVSFGNSCSFTNSSTIAYILFVPTTATAATFFSIGSSVTLNGTAIWSFNATSNDNLSVSIPAITYTGSGEWFFGCFTAVNYTINFAGNFVSSGPVTWRCHNTSTGTINLNNYNFTCTTLTLASYLTGSITVNCGSGNIVCTSLAQVSSATATFQLNMQTSQWTCSGNYTFGSNHTIVPSTSVVNITNTSTITQAGKAFYNLVINAATKAITTVGNLLCKGNFTCTAGKFAFAASARDSIYGDYINALPGGVGADSLNRNQDSLWLGGSMTTSGAVKNDMSRSYLYGTSLCNFTTNGSTVNYFDIRGTDRTKQMKLIDRLHIRKLLVTTGTLNTNGMDCFADSFITINDSIATVLGDTISSRKITFGASAKPVNGTPLLLYFGLALADTIRDSIVNSPKLGKLVVNKSGNGVTMLGVNNYNLMEITAGAIKTGSIPDTIKTDTLLWTSTDTSTMSVPMIIRRYINLGATTKVGWASTSKIISLAGDTLTIVANGKKIPKIVPKGLVRFR